MPMKKSGESVRLRLVYSDPTNDVAVVQSARPIAFATFSETSPQLGGRVVAAGFPLRGLLATQLGISNGIVANTAGPGDDTRLLQISCPVQPGNSGGPLLNDQGLVIGMVVSKLDPFRLLKASGSLPENINFAIEQSVVALTLQTAGVGFEALPRRTVMTDVEVSAMAQQFTLPIDCWK